jgi:hypothetical protein
MPYVGGLTATSGTGDAIAAKGYEGFKLSKQTRTRFDPLSPRHIPQCPFLLLTGDPILQRR